MFKKHKKIFIALSLILGYIIWSQTFSYNINKAVSHVEKHHCQKSHSCCAWFVMRAMQSGGCRLYFQHGHIATLYLSMVIMKLLLAWVIR